MTISDRKRVLVSWSTGKDSAWMLQVLQNDASVEVAGVMTTFNESSGRVAMHAVPQALADQQAASLGLPLTRVMLPWPCSNDDYEARMDVAFAEAVDAGVTHIAFGDLFLADIRDYRIRQLDGTGLEPLFPIWCDEHATGPLARQMIASGIRAVVSCVDPKQLDPGFVGREFDRDFLAELPPDVDPCGERGEFHTFVFDGPPLSQRIDFTVAGTTEISGFAYADLRSAAAASAK